MNPDKIKKKVQKIKELIEDLVNECYKDPEFHNVDTKDQLIEKYVKFLQEIKDISSDKIERLSSYAEWISKVEEVKSHFGF